MKHIIFKDYLPIIVCFAFLFMTNLAVNITYAKIVFTSKRVGDKATHIYVMNDDGSNVQRITRSLDYDRLPCWLPGGNQILFERDLSRGNGTVQNAEFYMVNAIGHNAHTFIKNHPTDTVPKISPDGKTVAFNSNRSGNWDIYTFNLDRK